MKNISKTKKARIKSMKKKLCTLLVIFTLTLASSITAFAAPEIMSDGGVFDAEYYAENNPDVVSVVGTEPEALRCKSKKLP